MKINVKESAFHDAFIRANRGEQFSYAARSALFDYLEELEQDTGEEMELDVIALCCEWSEFDSSRDACGEYGWTFPEREEEESDDEYTDRVDEAAMDWLTDRTNVVDVEGGGVLVLQF